MSKPTGDADRLAAAKALHRNAMARLAERMRAFNPCGQSLASTSQGLLL